MTQGDLKPFLDYIKTEPKKLRLEVRQKGKVFVYYKKCKILELGLRSYNIDEKYFDSGQKPYDIKEKIVNNPRQYFKDTLSIVDKWLDKHQKKEFETQQNIACENQKKNDRYIIIDMEYNFSQDDIKSDREKRAGFDLLGIDRESGKIVFFELKRGLKALTNKSGIKCHIEDFENYLIHGTNKNLFLKNLKEDIEYIVSNKKELGLIDNFDLPTNFLGNEVELIFVFESVDCDMNDYRKIYEREYSKSSSTIKYRTIFVTSHNLKLTWK